MELAHSDTTRTSTVITWDATDGVEAYVIHRGQPREEMLELATIHPRQTMFGDPGLQPATTYVYQVTEILAEDEVREPDSAQIAIRTQPPTEFASVQEFVNRFVAPTFRRELTEGGGAVWCDEWWRHAEAVRLLEALWWSYEAQHPAGPRAMPTKSRADFFAYHFYPLFDRLVGATGTFRKCEPDRDHHNTSMEQLPVLANPTSDYPAAFDPSIPAP